MRIGGSLVTHSRLVLRLNSHALCVASIAMSAWICLTVVGASHSDEFDIRVALRAALDSSSFVVPLVSAGSAAFVAGRLYGERQAEQRHLEGSSPRTLAAIVIACSAPLTLNLAVIAAAVTVGSLLLTDEKSARNQGLISWDGLAVMLGPPVWCALGVVVARLAGRRLLAMLLVALGMLVSFAGQRLATYQPAILFLYSFSPNGSWTAMLTGQSVLYLPGSERSFTSSVVSLLCWSVLASLALWVGVSPARRPLVSGGSDRRRPDSGTRVRLSAAVVTSLIVGFFAPFTLAQYLPWYYRVSWAAMEAHHTTPADAATDLVTLARLKGVSAVTLAATTRSDQRMLRRQIQALAKNADISSIQNLLDAREPGRVAINMGRAVQEGTEQVLPEQWMLCFKEPAGGITRWQLRAIAQNGGDCG